MADKKIIAIGSMMQAAALAGLMAPHVGGVDFGFEVPLIKGGSKQYHNPDPPPDFSSMTCQQRRRAERLAKKKVDREANQ